MKPLPTSMIYPDPSCIFVHVPKAAGQSVESVFLDRAGLTWETRDALLLRENDDPALGPPRLAHLTAADYVACGHVTQAEWDAAFTFAFVRNPWARAVSLYKWHDEHRRVPFSVFVQERIPETYWTEKYYFFRPQWEYVSDASGTCLVDFVGRLETIRADWATVAAQLGWDGTTLPHKNKADGGPLSMNWWRGWRGVHRYLGGAVRQYRYERARTVDYYEDDATIQAVADLYAADVEHFGYRFEDLTSRSARPTPLSPRRPLHPRVSPPTRQLESAKA